VATGGAGAAGVNRYIPSNAIVEAFVPFTALMPHVDVMVTNGGFGGVQFALAHCVPLVVAGTTEDKPEVAARVAWSGAGINLATRSPAPDHIRRAVHQVLTDPCYRQRAGEIRNEIAASDPAHSAADLIERLALTGEPVHRSPEWALDEVAS
jgi:UDP:flavonoid glycosyltransferase YjiC (YdhE family)